MIPKAIKDSCLSLIHKQHPSFECLSEKAVFGGDINQTAQIIGNKATYFVKWNEAKAFPKMFELEAQGLELLAQTKSCKIPKVVGFETLEEYSFLLLEFIETGEKTSYFWANFGRNLAQLHQTSAPHFGLETSNYIGSLVQKNNFHDSWVAFFIQERLEPMIHMAANQNLLKSTDIKMFTKLFYRLDRLFPVEVPSLLHGDLWSGNFISSKDFGPVLIDPAVYFGHREMDLAMSQLFGCFDPEFYTAYHQEFPLETQWQERVALCNLYPLLVHLNLFGFSYLPTIQNTIKLYL